MRSILSKLLLVGVVCTALIPGVSLAKTFVNPLAKVVWYKYGVNPWSKDTDNDGFADVWELQNNYCPTFPGILPLTDPQCRKGSFDLNKQTYTPPANVSFYPARQMFSVASCPALQKVLATEVHANVSLDAVAPGVAVFGADDAALVRTDSRAAYVLTGQTVRVVSLGNDAKLLSSIKLSADSLFRPDRIYVNGTTLIAAGPTLTARIPGEEASRIEVWDIKNLSAPARIRTLELTGAVLATHVSDGSLYVALSPQSYSDQLSLLDTTNSIPPLPALLKGIWFYRDLRSRVEITSSTSWKTLSTCGNIEYPAPLRGRGTVELVALSFKYPLSAVVSKTVYGLSAGSGLYFTPSNLYVVSSDYNYSWLSTTSEERTELYRLNLTKNRFTWAGSQTVPGTIVPGALDEYQSKVRIATTKRNSPLVTEQNNFVNSIYVLDTDLTRLVWAEGFAPYERMIDVTFAGNKMYVRTDHEEKGLIIFGHGDYFTPKQLGRVMSPGSLDVQPLSAGYLLTLGHNEFATSITSTVTSTMVVSSTVGASTTPTSTIITTTTAFVSSTAYAGYGGIKLSLINAALPENSYEFPVVIGDRGSSSDALENSTVLAIDTTKTYAAFPTVAVSWAGLPTLLNQPFSLIRDVPPSSSTVTNSGIYAFSLNHDFGPQFLGTVALPASDWSETPSPTLGMFFKGGMLYTATAHRLLINIMPSLSLVKEVTW